MSKDNSIQSGALGTWPRSTISGNDYHDLGLGFLPILEFTGTSIVVDSADELVILFYCVLVYKITLAIFYNISLFQENYKKFKKHSCIFSLSLYFY